MIPRLDVQKGVMCLLSKLCPSRRLSKPDKIRKQQDMHGWQHGENRRGEASSLAGGTLRECEAQGAGSSSSFVLFLCLSLPLSLSLPLFLSQRSTGPTVTGSSRTAPPVPLCPRPPQRVPPVPLVPGAAPPRGRSLPLPLPPRPSLPVAAGGEGSGAAGAAGSAA